MANLADAGGTACATIDITIAKQVGQTYGPGR